MIKRKFPKDLKFGTYLPKRCGMSYIKLSDCAASLERFMSEYFAESTTVTPSFNMSSDDAVYIDGEYTAYLFRNIMSFLGTESRINISIRTSDNRFMIVFSKSDGAFQINDAEILQKLLDSARLSGFEMTVAGNTLSFSAMLERGKLVISALTRTEFFKILERVFFG